MFELSGKVIEGLGKGKKLGFPTLNLDPKCAPAKMTHGVYVAKVHTRPSRGEAKQLTRPKGASSFGDFGGVLHYGKRHVHDGKVSLEVFCFGLDKDLYGTSVDINVGRKLRDVHAFKNESELQMQISKDVESAKQELNLRT
ncbi:riboflavin kinase [Candidatus Peregrinibacteria bacterium]|nr:riboflavin kinase [Candidatus Peregrinibacteria bacterium]